MRRWIGAIVAVGAALLALRFGVSTVCGSDARSWQRGDRDRQLALARGVADWLERDLDARRYATGSARFDGEWLFGTYVMAAYGFAQVALEHPDTAPELVPKLSRAIDAALSDVGRSFDRAAWNEDPIASLDGDHAHVAYLGYLGIALGLERKLDSDSPHAELHDRIAAALERRFRASPSLLLETYPGERYPVDNASAIATLALHADATGRSRPAVIADWTQACRGRFMDAETGLLIQAMAPDGATPVDRARGSGTALGVYFLSCADPELSRDQQQALERELSGDVLGFGVVREYARGQSGSGDIDSGPLVFGWSISAMGFSLAGCRIHGDERCFRERYAAYHLFGAPLERAGRWSFVSGGPLGDAILLAMLSAPRRAS